MRRQQIQITATLGARRRGAAIVFFLLRGHRCVEAFFFVGRRLLCAQRERERELPLSDEELKVKSFANDRFHNGQAGERCSSSSCFVFFLCGLCKTQIEIAPATLTTQAKIASRTSP
jgi:hypothetical protein